MPAAHQLYNHDLPCKIGLSFALSVSSCPFAKDVVMSDLSNPNPKPVIINGIDVYNFMDFFFGCKVPMPIQPFAKQMLDDVDAYMCNNCEWGGLSDVSSDSSTARSETPLQYSDQANLDTESPRLHSYSSHGSIDEPSAMSQIGRAHV